MSDKPKRGRPPSTENKKTSADYTREHRARQKERKNKLDQNGFTLITTIIKKSQLSTIEMIAKQKGCTVEDVFYSVTKESLIKLENDTYKARYKCIGELSGNTIPSSVTNLEQLESFADSLKRENDQSKVVLEQARQQLTDL